MTDNNYNCCHCYTVCLFTGDTPLFEACFEGHKGVVQYLVENAGDLAIYNERKTNCLMIAAYADNVEVIKHLVENGAGNKTTLQHSKLLKC